MQPYEVIRGATELRLRVSGTNLEALFRHALLAMCESLEPELTGETHSPNTWVDFTELYSIKISAENPEELLFQYLSQVLGLLNQHREIFTDVEFEYISDKSLSCRLSGKRFSQLMGKEIKAITHRDMDIKKVGKGLVTDIVCDI